MQKVGLVVKWDKKATEKAEVFERWLATRQVVVVRKDQELPEFKGLPQALDEDRNINPATADMFCVFVLGGDGTFLSAARWIGDLAIPVIGVKFGEVGFLAEIVEEQLFEMAEAVLAHKFTLEKRMRLTVTVIRDDEILASENVLNDVVINRGALSRLAHMKTYIDNRYLTTFRSDGLILSTPTGSTAYSLAAGGPILHPSVPGIIMTPICPFTLTNRPLILPETASIKITIAEKTTDIVLTFDGQKGMPIKTGDTIIIRKGENPVQMICLPAQNYFDVLKTKLRWSGGRS